MNNNKDHILSKFRFGNISFKSEIKFKDDNFLPSEENWKKNKINMFFLSLNTIRDFSFFNFHYLIEYINKLKNKESKSIEPDLVNTFSDYEISIKNKFNNLRCSVVIVSGENNNKDNSDYALDAFDLIASNLNESLLVSNIDSLTVTSDFKNQDIKLSNDSSEKYRKLKI